MKNIDKFLPKFFLVLMKLLKDGMNRIRGLEYYGPYKKALTNTNNVRKEIKVYFRVFRKSGNLKVFRWRTVSRDSIKKKV